MSKRTIVVNRRGLCALVTLLILLPLVLSACGGAAATPEPTEVASEPTSPPTEPPAPTETQAPTEPPPTETPAPTDTSQPTDTPEPTATPTQIVVDDSACINCHTDQETLKLVAVEEEKGESLSEGEG